MLVNTALSAIELNSDEKREVRLEIIQMYALFVLTVGIVYYLPETVGLFFFSVLFIVVMVSRKDYFWYAYYIIISCSPGNLLHVPSLYIGEATASDIRGALPQFNFGVLVSVTEVIFLILLAKAVLFKRKKPVVMSGYFKIILIYAMLLLVVTFEEGTILRVAKDLRYILLFFNITALTFLIQEKMEFYKFLHLLFSIMYFVFFTALYFFIFDDQFVHLFSPGLYRELAMGDTKRLWMSGGQQVLPLLSYFISVFLIFRDLNFNRKTYYFMAIAFMSFFSIFLTGTRTWFACLMFIIAMAFISAGKRAGFMKGIAIVFPVLMIPYFTIPQVKKGVDGAWGRLSTIVGAQAVDTYEDRMESAQLMEIGPVMRGIRENPLFGRGFSEYYAKHGNYDLGNLNLIFHVGILGFTLFLIFWLAFLRYVYHSRHRLARDNPYRKTLPILAYILLGLMIPHFTTEQIFDIVMSPPYILMITVYFFASKYFIDEAFHYESLPKETEVDLFPDLKRFNIGGKENT